MSATEDRCGKSDFCDSMNCKIMNKFVEIHIIFPSTIPDPVLIGGKKKLLVRS